MPSLSRRSRETRSTARMSMPTRMWTLGGTTGSSRDHVSEVRDREELDHVVRVQAAGERRGVDLWHHRLQVLEPLLRDHLVGVAELVVRDATLHVVAEVVRLDLHAR